MPDCGVSARLRIGVDTSVGCIGPSIPAQGIASLPLNSSIPP